MRQLLKKCKKIGASFLAICLIISMLPIQVFAEGTNITVKVSVENNTFLEAGEYGAPSFTGELFSTEVEVPVGSTGYDAFTKALKEQEISYEASDEYFAVINDLGEFDGGTGSGWMVTINDWFVNTGVRGYIVENNDEIKFQYTCNLGEDLGGTYNNNDKTLKALSTNVGTLSPTFSSDIQEYTLTVPTGTKEVVVTPTATNKNFQVRSSVDKVEYKRIEAIPVEDGTIITVKCGDPSWPSMNNQSGGTGSQTPAEVYKIKVVEKGLSVTFDADNGTDNIVKSVKNGVALNFVPEEPTKKGYTFVGWYKDTDDTTTQYTNNAIYTEDVTYKAKWAHVQMLGAQGKIVVNDESGIRFGTKIYNDGDEILEKGTIILPKEFLADGEKLTLSTPKTVKSIGKVNYETNEKENYVTYLGTLVGISSTNFDQQVTAASYVIYKDKTGNKYTVYSQYPNGSISVNQLLPKTN